MDEATAGDNKTGEGTVASSGAKTAAQCSVITVYKAKIGGALRTVTVVWSKTLINHSLSVSVDHPAGGEAPSTCRVDLKPWPFWGKKGFKSLETGDHRVDLFWDLRSAKFPAGGGPEPICGYYVALVSGEEVVLLVGDFKKEAYKRTRARPSLDDAAMVSKRDNVVGKKCFSTRARFDGRGKREHEIVVENSISGGCDGDAEMWISIDGVVAIHVSNLQWKFRGNETVMVESSPVQVFWDVHDWLFGGAAMGHALFIFKPGAATADQGGEEEWSGDDMGCLIESGSGRDMGSARRNSGGGAPEFCFMLCAWKVE
ncbi:hypothetical protein KSP40_PGU002878 [Platanthera guangdongensis]|uniref:DUF868 family protein n=1 Tax=Platanthera guangdongensis TaxID=2320717 RepID=A0ABR2LFW3_9ASPA